MRLAKTRKWFLFANSIRMILPFLAKRAVITDDHEKLEEGKPLLLQWTRGCKKPLVGLVQDTDSKAYWTKFERFLKNNEIPYRLFPIHKSTWLTESLNFDIIIWRPMSYPVQLEEARRKIYILEKHLHKICYPSFETVMIYEDKIIQHDLLKMNHFPQVNTFISYDRDEILEKTDHLVYPIIQKITAGSGSISVEKIKDSHQAARVTKDIFSFAGRRTYWPYLNQKDYVFFQQYQKNMGYDLRIIVIGNCFFGYYRDVPPGEFRASGMNKERYGALPEDAMLLAKSIAEKFDFICIAVDMVRDPDEKQLHIIELSAFTQVNDVYHECQVNGVPGHYVFSEEKGFRFKEEKVWLQEIVLKEFFERKWLNKTSIHELENVIAERSP